MKILLKFNENTKLFLASYFYRLNENELTEDLIIRTQVNLMGKGRYFSRCRKGSDKNIKICF
jgi:hypothetical protein